jgi:hypothetical protein
MNVDLYIERQKELTRAIYDAELLGDDERVDQLLAEKQELLNDYKAAQQAEAVA